MTNPLSQTTTTVLPQASAAIPDRSAVWIKRCIWAYILLLVFEGALRKWFLPGLASPLLVVRDPIALAGLLFAYQSGRFPLNNYVIISLVIGILGTATALSFGHGNVIVAAYGARIFLVHLPFAFLMGSFLSRTDVERIGKAFLWLSVPMAVLIFLQFYSPQSAWVNRGVGGDMEGAGFAGAMGYARPPGTFSFTNGVTQFFAITGVFALYFWLVLKKADYRLVWAATGATLVAIPLSISRSLAFQAIIACGFAGAVLARNPRFVGRLLAAVIGIVVLALILSRVPAFSTATDVLLTRFDSAAKSEGGTLEGTIGDRYIGGLIRAVEDSLDVDIFGGGLGLGTNVGARLTVGKRTFLIAEGEWPRTIGELGPVLGLTVIGMRLVLTFSLLQTAFRKLGSGDPLLWMLMSVGTPAIATGGLAQPAGLGFVTLIIGLAVAAASTTQE